MVEEEPQAGAPSRRPIAARRSFRHQLRRVTKPCVPLLGIPAGTLRQSHTGR